jgi:hypothetical protein
MLFFLYFHYYFFAADDYFTFIFACSSLFDYGDD